jgi:hypothetical protein
MNLVGINPDFVIDSNICVAMITGLPARFDRAIICF